MVKRIKSIVGILSVAVFIFIFFQSCTTEINKSYDNDFLNAVSSPGTILALTILIAGMIGTIGKNFYICGFVGAALYLVGAVFGLIRQGDINNGLMFAGISLLFAISFAFDGYLDMKKKAAKK